jgi:hypothetical protein
MSLRDLTRGLIGSRDERAAEAAGRRRLPSPGSYLTDGAALFRVSQTLPGSVEEGPLLELEDCGTLEILLCSARTVARAGLRSVTPVHSA